MSEQRQMPSLDWNNFAGLFNITTTRFAARTAFRFRARGAKDFDVWSFERVGREGRAFIATLRAAGLKPGDRVAIWSDNRPEWCVAYLAAAAAGFIVVPIDALLPEDEAGRLLEASEAAAVLVSPKFIEGFQRLRKNLPSILAAVFFGEGDGVAWEALASAAVSEAAGATPAEGIDPESPAVLIFTSGTTGTPKAVTLSHRSILNNMRAALTALNCWPEDVMISVLPLHHTYPATCSFLSPYAVGASVTICERIIGKVIVDDTRDSGGTFLIGVPLLFEKLADAIRQAIRSKPLSLRLMLKILGALSLLGSRLGLYGVGAALMAPVRRQSGLGNVRLMVSGGGPLHASTARAFEEFGFCLVQGYGMSENAPLVSVNPSKRRDNRTVGPAVIETEIRIAQCEQEQASPRIGFKIGEIQIRSSSLMLGYWKNDEATAEAFTDDGWFKTGDLGRLDRRGYLHITGRSKSIIVTSGGKNIYPEEIEEQFGGSRAVKEILVMGRKGKGSEAEEIVAAIFPDIEAIAQDHGADKAADEDCIRDVVKAEVERVNRTLPPYKKIVDFGLRHDPFEKTTLSKIKRYLYKNWDKALEK